MEKEGEGDCKDSDRMKYYAIDRKVLAAKGCGDEPWRRKSGGDVLVSESEVLLLLGYKTAGDFETETGAVAMTLGEAMEKFKS